MGPPCVGKTTLAKALSQAFNVEYIGVDELLKQLAAMDPPHPLQEEVAEAGEGPPDASHLSADLLTRIVQTVGLGSNGCRHKGFVLDGFPRSAEEANLLFMEQPPPQDPAELEGAEAPQPTLRS